MSRFIDSNETFLAGSIFNFSQIGKFKSLLTSLNADNRVPSFPPISIQRSSFFKLIKPNKYLYICLQ